MKKLISMSFLLLYILLFPSVSMAENAESPLRMEELSIKILPEFAFHPLDQKKVHPPLLVGYQGALINNLDHSIKGRIEIPLPMNEQNFRIGYVADYSTDLTKANEIKYVVDKEKGTISWTTSGEIKPQERYKFIIEFYTDSLKVNKDNRSLFYQFKSFADIGLVTISITQPNKAKNIKLTPPPAETGHEENTFTYYFQNMKSGEEQSFTLTYDRNETRPMMEHTDEKIPSKENGNNKKTSNVVIGAFSGISLLLAGTLAILIKHRKRE